MKLDFLKKQVDASAVDDGVWMQFTNPIDGRPLFLDEAETKPCRARIRSVNSTAFRECVDAIRRRVANVTARSRPAAAQRSVDAESALEQPRKLVALITGLENVSSDGPSFQPGPSLEDAKEMYADSTLQWMVEQVFAYAENSENYGAEATSAGNASAPAASPATPETAT